MLLARVHLGLSALALFAVEAGAAVTVYTTVEQDRRYSVQWSTEAYANTEDFCIDWNYSCEYYLSSFSNTGVIYCDSDPSQSDETHVEAYCGGSTARAPTTFHDYTQNCMRMVQARLLAGPEDYSPQTPVQQPLSTTTTTTTTTTSGTSSSAAQSTSSTSDPGSSTSSSTSHRSDSVTPSPTSISTVSASLSSANGSSISTAPSSSSAGIVSSSSGSFEAMAPSSSLSSSSSSHSTATPGQDALVPAVTRPASAHVTRATSISSPSSADLAPPALSASTTVAVASSSTASVSASTSSSAYRAPLYTPPSSHSIHPLSPSSLARARHLHHAHLQSQADTLCATWTRRRQLRAEKGLSNFVSKKDRKEGFRRPCQSYGKDLGLF